ncbi:MULTISPECIES: hypothetical protein [unclassified Caulobacter]|uniref:hypothetical protein n=1 Tax=unclassified Caulobacter TaxID=2648921 RepID=UPI0011B5779E|nr:MULTISPECIES: hypothetical protein [unclassified Caulobacter]
MRAIVLAFVCAMVVGASGAHADPVTLDWSVVDRFRLFKSPPPPSRPLGDSGPGTVDVFLDRLGAARATPGALFPESASYDLIADFLATKRPYDGGPAVRPFEATRWRGAGPGVRDGTLALKPPAADRGYEPGYLYPSAYAVRVWVVGGAAADSCAWRVDGVEALGPVACDQAVRIPIPARDDHTGGRGVRVTVTVSRDGAKTAEGEVPIEVRDRLVIGLGDSYASGEGNPDQPQAFPQNFQTRIDRYWKDSSDPYDRWWRVGAVLREIQPARWWDPICHRSLYSQQAAAAFIYAAEHPKEAVTFASFACSGAEVLDGVIASQAKPPGLSDFGGPDGRRPFVLKPQIEQALELLCDGRGLSGDARWAATEIALLAAELRLPPKQQKAYVTTATRTEAKCAGAGVRPRKVDVLLMSIGGNDIGFAGAVKNALLPTQASDPIGQFVLARVRSSVGVTPTYLAHRKIMFDLPRVYPVMRQALAAGLAPDGVPIIQSTYPNPLLGEGDGARFCHGFLDNQLFASMNGMFPDQGVRPENRWRIGIDEAEGREVFESLFTPLNQAVAQNASNKGWRVVRYGEAFSRRGWCAGTEAERATFAFPALSQAVTASGKRQWSPFDPQDWNPYAPRTRLFRTSNDVVLTQIGSSEPFVKMVVNLGNRSFFASAGIFHPTAQAHVIIGLNVVREMEQALEPPSPGVQTAR